MALEDESEADGAYLDGADAGRIAARGSLDPDDALIADVTIWRVCGESNDELLAAYRDGWWKSYRDARAKLRARLRSVV